MHLADQSSSSSPGKYFPKIGRSLAKSAMGAMLSRGVCKGEDAAGNTAKACEQTEDEAASACFRGVIAQSSDSALDPRKHGTHGTQQGPLLPIIRGINKEEFRERYGSIDTGRALCAFTPAGDTAVVLALLNHMKPKRIVEIGTAAGHMTANLSEWSPEDAEVFSIGVVAGMGGSGAEEQRVEDPPEGAFGKEKDHFGKGHKVKLIVADSLTYDFGQLGPIDFAFIDGAHDYEHVLSDSVKVYEALSPGGVMVWHDFGSASRWVEVRRALEVTSFAEPIVHVEGTQVAFLQKSGTDVGCVSGAMLSRGVCKGEDVAGNTAKACEQTEDEAASACFRGVSRHHTDLAQSPRKHGTHGTHHDTPRAKEQPVRIVWEGGFTAMHSLALVNREVCGRLAERGHELSVRETHTVTSGSGLVMPEGLRELCDRKLSGVPEVHVAHQWPPDFRPPAEGHWVIMQPWEFGSLPKAWIGPMAEQVDEVWVPSRFVRDCFIKSGVPAERVAVIPLGVNLNRGGSGVARRKGEELSGSQTPFGNRLPETPFREPDSKRSFRDGRSQTEFGNQANEGKGDKFRFLFVGGTIQRKGIDLLLKAYGDVFSDRDDVCLVIKDMGVGTFYRDQTAERLLAEFRARPHAPALEYIDRELTAWHICRLSRTGKLTAPFSRRACTLAEKTLPRPAPSSTGPLRLIPKPCGQR